MKKKETLRLINEQYVDDLLKNYPLANSILIVRKNYQRMIIEVSNCCNYPIDYLLWNIDNCVRYKEIDILCVFFQTSDRLMKALGY